MKMNYPVLEGLGHDDVQDAFGPLWGIPVTVLIARDGRICAKHTGMTREGDVRAGDQDRSCSHVVISTGHDDAMLKGFTHARLACGCRIAFRDGVEGSP